MEVIPRLQASACLLRPPSDSCDTRSHVQRPFVHTPIPDRFVTQQGGHKESADLIRLYDFSLTLSFKPALGRGKTKQQQHIPLFHLSENHPPKKETGAQNPPPLLLLLFACFLGPSAHVPQVPFRVSHIRRPIRPAR